MLDERRFPPDLSYHEAHDWARVSGTEAIFGITWFAQDSLGEIVYWEGPEVGALLSRGESYAELESVKAVSDVVAPLSGTVLELNETLDDDPVRVNSDPYSDGWLVRVRLSDPSEVGELMSAEDYSEMVANG